MKQLNIGKRRIIALVLLTLAFITLFFDFTVISNRFLRELGASSGAYSKREILSKLSQSLLLGDISDSDEAALVRKAIRVLDSGGVSPLEARSLLSLAGRFARSMGEYVPGLTAAIVIVTILIILMFLAFVLAVYGIFRRGEGGIFWFAVMQLIALGVEIYTVIRLNSEADASVLVLTAWPFIGLILAISSCVVCAADRTSARGYAGTNHMQFADEFRNIMSAGKRVSRVMKRATGRAAASAAAGAASFMAGDSWTCPQCGRTAEGSDRFCGACGAQRPEKPRCPKCGVELRPGLAFCTQCGARLADATGGQRPQPQAQPFQPQTQPFQQPAQPLQQPAQPLQQPAQPFRQPAQPFQQPAQPFQQPAQSYQQPAQSLQQPAQSLQQPAQPFQQPAQLFQQPAQSYQQPAQSFRQPAQPFQQPGYYKDPDDHACPTHIFENARQSAVPLTIEVCQDRIGFRQECRMNLQDNLTIGRGSACNLQLDDKTVSGMHLRLRREGNNLFVTDLHSTNGTMLNGTPLTDEAPLKPGDRLNIGYTRLCISW